MINILGVDIRTLILVIVTVINIVLGALIYISSKERSSAFFSLAIIFVVVWTAGITVYIQPGLTPLTQTYSNINYISGALVSVFYFYFAYLFGSEAKKIGNSLAGVSTAALLFIIFLILAPFENRAIIAGIDVVGDAKVESFGWGYPFYVLFVAAHFFSGFAYLLQKFRRQIGTMKRQLGFVILGTGIAIVFGLTTNVLLPNIGLYGYEWLGPIGTLVMVSVITYAVMRHNLWNFRVVAVELFITLIILTLTLHVLLADSIAEVYVKAAVLFIVVIFSYYLTRGMLQEADAQKEMRFIASKLEQANKRLREVDAEKSDFVSITSHQFRAPLTVIKGYSSMILEGLFGATIDTKQREVYQRIFRASQRLVLLIEEFMNITRIESNAMHLAYKKVDLKKLLEDSIAFFKDTFEESGLKFFYEARGAGKYFVKADTDKLGQVLRNVLDNALKYTRMGGSVNVRLEANDKTGTFLIAVKDSGIGMTREMIERLFEKFSRAEDITKLHTEGRGLGMYIAKLVVAAHHGRIWAESPGRDMGSTFYIELPDMDSIDKRQEIKEFIENL